MGNGLRVIGGPIIGLSGGGLGFGSGTEEACGLDVGVRPLEKAFYCFIG